MGDFAKRVRRNQTAGPSQRGFKRSEWESLQKDDSLDEDDKRLLNAGLFFDNLLCSLRDEKRLSEIALRPTAITRLLIALATHNYFLITQQTKPSLSTRGKQAMLDMSSVLAKTVQLHSGQEFSPDELITGLGDGLKHILRELLEGNCEGNKHSEYEAASIDIDKIYAEYNKAILYQCAVEYWHDCVGNGYYLTKHEQGVALTPYDTDLVIARTASTYRRLSIALQNTMVIIDEWLHTWSRANKEKLCEIPLVCRIHGQDRIERIELGINNRVLTAASSGVVDKLWLQQGYYRAFLDEPLPNFSGFTLNQIITGWRLLQSLAVAIFQSLSPIGKGDKRELLRFAPRIPKRVLVGTFSRALSFDCARAELLIKVFVFDLNHTQEVWLQPLVSLEEDYCLVVPCIHSVHLQRIVEGWMRQGGLDLDRRGPEFEQFCRSELSDDIKKSQIMKSVTILYQPVRFKPAAEREEEIDIVILVANTVLLVEAKCILWPDDSLQFANYRDTVVKAVRQITRKRDAVRRNYDSFIERIKELGYTAPAACKVICCVLTNSAVYSGFPIEGVPIVDLSILGRFFKNEHVKMEVKHVGKSIQKHVIRFYENATGAGMVLEKYLSDPPQLSDTRLSIRKRELIFPMESPVYGKLVHETYRVEIDSAKLMERYGITLLHKERPIKGAHKNGGMD